jgi:hypothetical protein
VARTIHGAFASNSLAQPCRTHGGLAHRELDGNGSCARPATPIPPFLLAGGGGLGSDSGASDPCTPPGPRGRSCTRPRPRAARTSMADHCVRAHVLCAERGRLLLGGVCGSGGATATRTRHALPRRGY